MNLDIKKSLIFFNRDKIENILNYIGLTFILWSCILVLHSIYIICHQSILGKTYNLADLTYMQHAIGSIHGSILMAPIFLGIISIFIKKIKLWHVGFSIWLAFSLNSYQFFDSFLHPIFFKLHFFDIVMRPGQRIVNPQYTKILFYFLIIFILLIQCFTKKQRSVDRIFMLLIISSALVTTTVFHFAIPMGMFKMTKYELENKLIDNILYEPKNVLCAKKDCFYLDNSLQVIQKETNSNIEIYNKYSFILGLGEKIIYQNKQVFYSTSLGDINGAGFDYVTTVLQRTSNGYFLVFDSEGVKPIARHSEIWFSFLSTIAHFIWFYGGILVLFLHKQIMFRKLSPRFDLKEKN
jgi:hypothetical protein